MEQTKKCTCCGLELPVSQFSKAYSNLCKDCYAKKMREMREQIRETNLLVTLRKEADTKINDTLEANHWKALREQAAVAALGGLASRLMSHDDWYSNSIGSQKAETIVRDAIKLADHFVQHLKKEKE